MAEPAGGVNSDIVVGRQGIFTADGDVVGYELLFRQPPLNRIADLSGDELTADVIYRTNAIGLSHVVSGRMIFCNADRGLLEGAVPLHLPPEQTVIEILETVVLDPEVIAGCRRLVEDGYQIAVDNFAWRPGVEDLLDVASIVKVDVMTADPSDLAAMASQCKQFGVRLLAQKVEDLGQLDQLRDMGFELFQGYALERPQLVAGAVVEPDDLNRLHASAELLTTELDLEEVEEVIRRDPALAIQVMQLASVGRMGETRRTISTLREALVLAGSRRVQNWVALLLARPHKGKTAHDRFTATLIRARACELLAMNLDPSMASMGFAAGMLSAVDILLGVSPVEARAALALSDELNAAAFGSETPLGRIVRDAVDFQLGRVKPRRHSTLSDDTLNEVFSTAFAWAVSSTAALDEADH